MMSSWACVVQWGWPKSIGTTAGGEVVGRTARLGTGPAFMTFWVHSQKKKKLTSHKYMHE